MRRFYLRNAINDAVAGEITQDLNGQRGFITVAGTATGTIDKMQLM